METLRNYKYRIYPKGATLKALENTLDVCRDTYNKVLEARKGAYEKDKTSLGLYGCQNLVRTWTIKNVHSQVVQNVCSRVDLAFQGFFRRVKEKGTKAGYPRFRGRDRYKSFTFPQNGFSLKGTKLKLSKIGTMKMVLHRPLEGTIKTCTLKREGDRWYVLFACSVPKRATTRTDMAPIGIDVGCIDFATLSNGETIEHPKYLRASEGKLKKAQSKYSLMKMAPKEDKKKVKLKKNLVRLHWKVQNQRTDFLHKVSFGLSRKYSLICVERLDINGMVKSNYSNLNKSILDSGWATFRAMLGYKVEDTGGTLKEVDPAYTSQTCSRCKALVKKDLQERTHSCPHCGLVLGRDHNAAINILTLGLQSMGPYERPLDAPTLVVGE